ncbi:stage V sporulation protein D (sporulation-specific penicillin-binding protein) [Clostridium cavendishii DSM 21758]|uniref:Stage V sporulation protein D (Sporulation-specific penicillin-binding protein) n=1 Tax=Clostridium cavendishii DSM 21758 TaxID=1121302 RepID=A0A1M6BLI2_9CLOT|nr:penicillin-binding transpeptidase domain-containing protein [Clostridium cavendishii]SHI49670.1 stage V sporulation protein D (sporulation-specific penicillin-binding protein) [Clostridium cavendishii DSM 21758]
MKKSNKKRKIIKPVITEKRMLLVNFGVVLVLISLVGRLAYIMIWKKTELTAKATEQWTSEMQIEPKRGKILDRDGKELVRSASVYRVDLDLDTLRDTYFDTEDKKKHMTPNQMASKIAPILGMKEEEVLEKLQAKLKSGAPAKSAILARRIENDVATKIKDLKILGLVVSSDTKRYYTNNNFLSHILGTTSADGKGLSGIELEYNKELTGVPGMKVSQIDAGNRENPYSTASVTNAQDGHDIVLTIDEKIQYYAEEIAQRAFTEQKAKTATVIVSNPKNGEILALANKPDFNPNKPYEGVEKFDGNSNSEKVSNMWSNWAVSTAFEPGSTFKMLTAYAGLEYGVVNEDSWFNCPGYEIVDGIRINCWKQGGHGHLNLSGILENSCNPGFMQLGKKIKKENLNECIQRFGLGKPSGVDLPGESAGVIKKTEEISNVDLANISFGQTDTVNAVQLMASVNAIANGGTLIQPHVMKEVSHVDESGKKVVDKTFDPKKQVVGKPEIAAEVRADLKNVIEKGSGKPAKVDGYSIAGKTGTSEKLGSKDKDKKIASFVGMAPAEDPNVTVMIIINEPNGEQYFGGVIAAPLAHDLFSDIFSYNESKKD